MDLKIVYNKGVRSKTLCSKSGVFMTAPQEPHANSSEQPAHAVQPAIALESVNEVLADLWSKATSHTYQPGSAIVRQGEGTDAFYVITEGEVHIIKEIKGQLPEIIKRLYKGNYFGEIGLLQSVNRTATVIASRHKVEVLRLEQDVFHELVEKYKLTSAEIAGLLLRRAMTSQLAAALPTLGLDQIAKVLPKASILRFAKGATVVEEGSLADKFYIISSGQAEAVRLNAEGQTVVLGVMGEGDYFGEIGLLQSRPRTATVRAATDLAVISLNRDDFMRLMEQSPQTSEMLALVVVERLLNVAQA